MAFGENISKKRIYNPQENMKKDDGFIYLDGWKFSKEDKWKLVSHLHKSIRHGKAGDAAAAAKWIYYVDPAYARYRMAVIAFEDVAGASPEVIIDSMSNGWKKEDIENQGGHVFLQEQARKWASTIKDRTANDWVSCTRWLPEYLEKYNVKNVDDLSIEESLKIAWSTESKWWEKGIAAWRIAGTTKFPNSSLGKFEGDWEAWLSSCKENGVSEMIIECMMLGTATQKEGSPIFLAFVDLALQNEKVKTINDAKFIDLGYIGPYCSSSIDKHTSEGKKAIEHYVYSNKKLTTWLVWKNIDLDIAKNLLGKIQFWLEGGILDKHLYYPTMKKINEDLKLKIQEDTKINGSEFFTFVNDFENWHKAREKYTRINTFS